MRTVQALFWGLTVTVAVRLVLPRLFGLLDSDSVVLFLDARRQMLDGTWSMVSTLPVYLVSIFYRLLDEKLYAARWVSVLAGVGVMLVVFEAAERGRHGRIAALLAGAIPAAVFFGTSALPYGLLTFCGVLGLWLLTRAVDERQPAFGALAGLSFALAFLCKTFSAVLILPAGVAVLQGLWRADRRASLRWLPPLTAVGVWALLVAAVIAWRWPVFGWSVLNDYPVDWRFDLAASVWSGRWIGLITLHALALPLLAPGIVVMWKERRNSTFARLGFWYALVIVAVYLVNPVNHFPRVLVPALPVAVFVAALAVDRLLRRGQWAALVAWTIVASALLLGHWLAPGWWRDGRVWPVVLATGAACLLVWAGGRVRRQVAPVWIDTSGAAFLAVTVLFGLHAGYTDLDRVERAYMARVDAVRFSGATGGVIGGSDALHLVVDGRLNFSTLLDLPRERLEQVLTEGLPAVMRSMGTPVVVADSTDSDGILPMLAALARDLGLPPDTVENPYADVEADPEAARIFDNGWFVIYHLEDVTGPESETWARWNRIQPPWDRTGMGLLHPTPSRLAVRQRPETAAPEGTTNRQILVELTDAPGGENCYSLRVGARNRLGDSLWEWAGEVVTDHDEESPGVRLARLRVDRPGGEGEHTLIVPSKVKGVRSFVIEAQPVGTGRARRVVVPVPAWW
ncbi:MAG: glycosyltransferase family 39 protein [Candidatus Lernaella stagnicola]|nr:glycosyltransferase family 39 protein [Candidatus Lernaella stagnicola]